MSDIVLYDYPRSTASYRVRIALNLAGLRHERVMVNLLEGEQSGAGASGAESTGIRAGAGH